MLELLRGYEPVADSLGTVYRPRVYSRVEVDGTWSGWLVFFPVPPGRVVSSGRETTQPTYDAIVHWATTLSPIYLEGALQRALALQPEAELEGDLARLYAMEDTAREEAALAETSAAVHELSADVARAEAVEARRAATELEATAATIEEADARRRKRMAKADGGTSAAPRKRKTGTRK